MSRGKLPVLPKAQPRFCILARSLALTAVVLAIPNEGHAETVIHWTNDASQDVITELSNGHVFTSDFKGVNDVQVSKLTGTVSEVFTETFGGSTPGNNPTWITKFVGNAAPQTGDGTPGRWKMLEPSSSANSFQFDFSIPFGSGDRMLVADVDQSEKYQIVAYKHVGSNYVATSVSSWVHQPFSGQTGVTPDARWATWNPADGTLTSSGTSLTEPLDVFAPDQNIDRVVFINVGGGGGTPAIQFAADIAHISVPGDYNLNGKVDAPDYVLWRNTLGQSGPNLAADGNENNSIETSDYAVWRSHFGRTPGSGALIADGTGSSVPEPGSIHAIVALLFCATAERRRLRSDIA